MSVTPLWAGGPVWALVCPLIHEVLEPWCPQTGPALLRWETAFKRSAFRTKKKKVRAVTSIWAVKSRRQSGRAFTHHRTFPNTVPLRFTRCGTSSPEPPVCDPQSLSCTNLERLFFYFSFPVWLVFFLHISFFCVDLCVWNMGHNWRSIHLLITRCSFPSWCRDTVDRGSKNPLVGAVGSSWPIEDSVWNTDTVVKTAVNPRALY